MADRWTGIDDEVMRCLADGRPLTPEEVATRMGISTGATISLLCLLALEGRVRIRLVAVNSAEVPALLEVA
jgi:hypothetical protein